MTFVIIVVAFIGGVVVGMTQGDKIKEKIQEVKDKVKGYM